MIMFFWLYRAWFYFYVGFWVTPGFCSWSGYAMDKMWLYIWDMVEHNGTGGLTCQHNFLESTKYTHNVLQFLVIHLKGNAQDFLETQRCMELSSN